MAMLLEDCAERMFVRRKKTHKRDFYLSEQVCISCSSIKQHKQKRSNRMKHQNQGTIQKLKGGKTLSKPAWILEASQIIEGNPLHVLKRDLKGITFRNLVPNPKRIFNQPTAVSTNSIILQVEILCQVEI